MNSIILEDIMSIIEEEKHDLHEMSGKTVFVTGATGLIGSLIVNTFIEANRRLNLNIKIICLVRDIEKAKNKFCIDEVKCIIDSVTKITNIEDELDYIIHTANPTASSFFVNNPVETIKSSVLGTMNVLEIARKKGVKGFIFLSTMEVYGFPKRGHVVSETEVAGFDTSIIRNCYPISKQLCESMCSAYSSEYGVPAIVIRLTQTFGAGVDYNDGRVFAEFMRCAVEARDIVLRTKGKTERCYLYTADAVCAIMKTLIRGIPGEIYTAANPETYCSIIDMAYLVVNQIAEHNINVIIDIDGKDRGYAKELYMKLDVSKLMKLGWKPRTGLIDMYKRMIKACEEVV
jgi:nucleoside-diphosphate-sugar epimerase